MVLSHPVLVPAYKAEATLEATLHSLQAQDASTLALVEKIVLADDGPRDRTVEIANKVWGSELPLLELWPNEVNISVRATVNRSCTRLKENGVEWS
jgi:cellulose synthase/poly-beta-1,6-N-acetylglucosamine synthase-like glycosyltransferase